MSTEEKIKDEAEQAKDATVSKNEKSEENTVDEKKEVNPEEVLQKEKEKYLRLFAEFENYKKRTTKERIELYRTAGQDIITSLLPVLDDFDRGLS